MWEQQQVVLSAQATTVQNDNRAVAQLEVERSPSSPHARAPPCLCVHCVVCVGASTCVFMSFYCNIHRHTYMHTHTHTHTHIHLPKEVKTKTNRKAKKQCTQQHKHAGLSQTNRSKQQLFELIFHSATHDHTCPCVTPQHPHEHNILQIQCQKQTNINENQQIRTCKPTEPYETQT